MIIELRAGDRLPLFLDIDGDFLALEGVEEPPTIVVKRRIFVHIDGRNPPRLSTDGQTLGTVGGTINVGLGASEDRGGPFANLSLTAFERE